MTEPDRVTLYAPAKINAFLEISGKRQDGYHEIRTLMIPVSLYDVIELDFGVSSISVECPDSCVPDDLTNLAAKAASLFFSETGISAGLSIKIKKNIPAGGGLGGGSSDAASVLKALNDYHGTNLGIVSLCRLALKIGADVPFFINSKPAIATGIGEHLSPVAGDLRPYELIIINPGVSLSTADVYKKHNLGLTKFKKENKYPALNQGVCDIGFCLHNDLETAAISLCPVIEDIKRFLGCLGADGVLMSGSGPSVFGIFTDSVVADRASAIIKENTKWLVFQVQMNL